MGQPLYAVWQSPEGYAVYWAIGYVPGHPQGETSLRVWVWVQKISLNTLTDSSISKVSQKWEIVPFYCHIIDNIRATALTIGLSSS